MEKQRSGTFNFLVLIAAFVVICLLYIAVQPTHISTGGTGIDPDAMETWLQEMEVDSDGNLAADKLHEYCNSEAAARNGFCTGYLLGFVEGYEISLAFDICTGESLQSASQIEQAFKNYMDDHPEHWKKPRAPILGAAIQQSFPCSSQY